MRIAILGTRGIPNRYGGFEQFAEYLAEGLLHRGHEVAVYVPHFHPYREGSFRGITLHSIYSPEERIGAAGNFLYDLLSLRHAVRAGYEVVLECGYGTSAPSYYLVPLRNTRIVTNMDGLEWKRAKWSPLVQWLMRRLEAMAARRSHALVADNLGIQTYLERTYGCRSAYIPYGAEIPDPPAVEVLKDYQVAPGGFFLAIARMEPENNLEMLVDGYRLAAPAEPLLIVGNHQTGYGKYLRERCQDLPGIRFLGAIYRKDTLDSLRCHARLYFHGHSVGGTNPSLLEAMAASAVIASHDNPFNRSVILDNALFFASKEDVARLMGQDTEPLRKGFREGNLARIRESFAWDQITNQYEKLFLDVIAGDPGTRSD